MPILKITNSTCPCLQIGKFLKAGLLQPLEGRYTDGLVNDVFRKQPYHEVIS